MGGLIDLPFKAFHKYRINAYFFVIFIVWIISFPFTICSR